MGFFFNWQFFFSSSLGGIQTQSIGTKLNLRFTRKLHVQYNYISLLNSGDLFWIRTYVKKKSKKKKGKWANKFWMIFIVWFQFVQQFLRKQKVCNIKSLQMTTGAYYWQDLNWNVNHCNRPLINTSFSITMLSVICLIYYHCASTFIIHNITFSVSLTMCCKPLLKTAIWLKLTMGLLQCFSRNKMITNFLEAFLKYSI